MRGDHLTSSKCQMCFWFALDSTEIFCFVQGMFDDQLLRLMEVLKKGRIWALNAGENFEVSLQAWEKFTKQLQHTAVAYMYVSEHHLARTDLKKRMQEAIRDNRR